MGTWTWLFILGQTVAAILLVQSVDEAIPRLTLQYGSPDRKVKRFEEEGVSHYTTLLLSKDGSTLYVGAREALFSLSSANFTSLSMLTWKAEDSKKKECTFKGKDAQRDCQNYIKILLQVNSTHLYTCGTYAFSPNCTYIKIDDFTLETDSNGNPVMEDGKGRCPFDPEYKSSAIMVDGDLYGGTVSTFQGNEPIIYKSEDNKITLKTETSLNWLQDPAFVGSAHIPENLPEGNPIGDDDKIYFFFTETGKEFDFFENPIVSRIARVCKGDLGGERVLQKKWTTFLKAQLLCTRPEDGFPFNVLKDMFVLTPGEEHWKNTMFYGVFTSQWNKGGVGSSAVCAFPMSDVQKAFSGLYKEVNRESQQWSTYTDSVPEPRPGACITNKARNMKINSSLQMPDRVLNFIKDHFLMDSPVRSQPLLLQSQMIYQQISVQRVKGLKKTYDVMFLGTDDGRLHKAVHVNKKVHVIEEIKLFPSADPVQELLIDHSKNLVYASSRSMVVQVPVSNCSMYMSCGECILSRDPYCAWSKRGCRSVHHHSHDPNIQHWLQDIENADTEKLCQQTNSSAPSGRVIVSIEEPECKKIVLKPNNATTLPCNLLSNLASRQWVHNEKPIDASYFVFETGDLILVNSPERLGTFECWSVEKDFKKLMVKYCVQTDSTIKTTTQRTQTEMIFHHVSAIDKDVNSSKYLLSSSSGSSSAQLLGKSYWNEFLIMTILFGVVVVIMIFCLLYKHRSGMKSILKPVENSNKKPSKNAENVPLNGNSVPIPQADHKGYQTLNDNYIISTPVHDSLIASKIVSESEKRPLNVKDTLVEVSPTCPRPRVRLGSEIRDSVV
ncbi:semaphorin-4B isoform X1 [Bufo gargarizans]|uniref:semaphorin-4B isoform X1 n=1 Tax=Bufo gargarizans TaxID=30331 RepID=UPI001CF5F2F0|nr:semaphorin-4B isoform X1 [Bufo gargarizans]